MHLAPGDPTSLFIDPNVRPEELARVRANWGLDQPIYIQYLLWLKNALLLDFGRSYTTGQPVILGGRRAAPPDAAADAVLSWCLVLIKMLLIITNSILLIQNMLDIHLIRESPEIIKNDLRRRGALNKVSWIDELLTYDKEWRSKLLEINVLRNKRNRITEEIAQIKKEGKD
jgi:hypothetical protein